ncbi:MAG: IS110 family transposase [Nevskiales bacterium]
MDVLRERSAGLDVHRSVIVACVLLSALGGQVTKEVRSFAATATGLAELAAWLSGCGVTHVGMEGTGVYWMPVYAALEAVSGITLVVANARHIKAVPGRKTDVIDAEWIARLIRYGLVRASFVPPQPIRHLRDLTRYRRTLVEVQASERRRLIKLLEATDMKLAEVLSDVFGVTGRAILRALIEGDSTPAQMAALARGHARKKIAPLTAALGGQLAEHQRFMLRMQLHRIEATEQQIALLDEEIEARLPPYRAQIALLTSIPGIDRVSAAAILAEIGPDMSAFVTAGHLAAWAGACPGNNESAGKKKPAAARNGNHHLLTVLCNAAISASRKKGSYFKAKYYSLKSRIGAGKAALAIGHKLLICIWHMLTNGCFYRDLGEDYLDRRNQQQTLKRYARKLDALGYAIVPKTEPAAMAA